MADVHALFERIKYADPALKKKIALGSLAVVLFLIAGVLLIRTFIGPDAPQPDSQTDQIVTELRKDLASDEPPQTVEEEMPPFQRGGQQEPN